MGYKNFQILFIVIALECPWILAAQNLSPVSFSLTNTPAFSGKYLNSTSIRGNLSYPIVKTQNTTLLAGIGFTSFYNTIQSDSLNIKNLYSISVPITFLYQLNKSFRLCFSFETGAGSDILSFAPVNFKYTSNLMLIKGKNDSTKWAVILQITNHNSGISFSPNFFINIHLFNKLYFNGILPFKPKLKWKTNKSSQIGLSVATERNSYFLSKSNNSRFIDEIQSDLDLFYQKRLNKYFKLQASFGYTFLHNYKIYEQGEKSPFKIYIFGGTKKAIPVLSDGLLFKLGIFWSTHD